LSATPPNDILQKAIATHQEGRLEEARRLYERVIADDPNNAHAAYLLCNVHAQQGHWDAAERRIKEAIAGEPDNALFYDTLGKIETSLNQTAAAEKAFRKAIQLQPGFAMAHTNLGRLLFASGDHNQAAHQFGRAIELQPEFAEPWVGLGDVRRAQVRHEDALEAYGKASGIQDNAWIQVQRGITLQMLDRLEEAETAYRQATQLNPDFADAHSHLGTVLQRVGRLDDARQAYEECLELVPGHGAALAGLLWIMDLRGQRDAALKMVRPLLEQGQLLPDPAISLARIHQHRGDTDLALALLEPLLNDDLRPAMEARLRFALGELRDGRGDYSQAFEHFDRGNRLKGMPFDADLHRRQFEALKDAFSQKNMARLPRSGHESQLPVFIVGMPRSGTSLVEEIITSHPQAHGAGELELISDLARTLPIRLGSDRHYPECVPELDVTHVTAMAADYLAALGKPGDAITLVSDKMPTNFLHLGLIELLLPRSRIIHCTRDPMDTGLSCFFHDFLGQGLSFSFDLRNIGIYYVLYEGLMPHWKEVLSLPLLEVNYEELVKDQENVTREMLEFVGLAWDDRCLRFYESDRTVITASSAQVRQPIYASSIGRWKHYEKYLQPLKEALEENRTGSFS